MYLKANQQLLIYIRDKSEVEKSRIVKAIESFALLKRKNELVISTLTSSAANEIGGCTVYITIEMNTWVRKTHKVKINIKWSSCCLFIVVKVSIMDMKSLTSIN